MARIASSCRFLAVLLQAAFCLGTCAVVAPGWTSLVAADQATAEEQAGRRGSRHPGTPTKEAVSPAAARAALEQAKSLLPRLHPYEIVLIDPELAADPAAVRALDAFTVREENGLMRPKVYINVESPMVRLAARGDAFHVATLAAVIVHEIEHLKGGNESAARRAERQFFEHLVAGGRVNATDGQRYLALLQRQAGPGQN